MRWDADAVARLSAAISEEVRSATWGHSDWMTVCTAVTRHFPGSFCAILNQNVDADGFGFLIADGLSRQHLDDFAAHYAAVNPWQDFWTKAANGAIIVSERDDPASKYGKSEFYNDWLKKAGEFDAAVGMRVYGTQRELIYIPVHYPVHLSPVYDPVVEKVMESLRPTLFEAIRIKQQIRDVGEMQNARAALIDRNVEIAFVIDETMRLHDANEAAAFAFARASPVRNRFNRIRLCDDNAQGELRKACRAILSAEAGAKTRFPLRGAEGPLIVSVARLPHVVVGGLLSALPQFLVQISDPKVPSTKLDEAVLARFYGLTASEARICFYLAEGLPLPEASARAGISYENGRQKLKSIFQKTGACNQGDLRVILSRL